MPDRSADAYAGFIVRRQRIGPGAGTNRSPFRRLRRLGLLVATALLAGGCGAGGPLNATLGHFCEFQGVNATLRLHNDGPSTIVIQQPQDVLGLRVYSPSGALLLEDLSYPSNGWLPGRTSISPAATVSLPVYVWYEAFGFNPTQGVYRPAPPGVYGLQVYVEQLDDPTSRGWPPKTTAVGMTPVYPIRIPLPACPSG